MTNTVIKYRRKPTPVKTAVLWVSLTSNLFLGAACYGVYTGQLARTDVATVQPVALHEQDYLTTLAGRK